MIDLNDLNFTNAEDVQTFKQRMLNENPNCLAFTISELKEILFLIKHFENAYKEFIAEGYTNVYPNIKKFNDLDLEKIIKLIYNDTRYQKVVKHEFDHCVATEDEIIKFIKIFPDLEKAKETIYEILLKHSASGKEPKDGYVVFTKLNNIHENRTLH